MKRSAKKERPSSEDEVVNYLTEILPVGFMERYITEGPELPPHVLANIIRDVYPEDSDTRIDGKALRVLRIVSEAFLINAFKQSRYVTAAAKRKTLFKQDFLLGSSTMKNGVPLHLASREEKQSFFNTCDMEYESSEDEDSQE